MERKVIYEKGLTTCKDENTIKIIEGIVQEAINNIQLSSNGGQILSSSLANEIGKRIRLKGINDYNVFIGEKYESAIRYERNSLITFKWDDLRILLLKCPGKPIYPSEEIPEIKIKDSKEIEAK